MPRRHSSTTLKEISDVAPANFMVRGLRVNRELTHKEAARHELGEVVLLR